MVLTIIMVLLFAIAVGNEGSRKVLVALATLAWTAAIFLTIAAIAIGILLGVIAFAASGSPYGPPMGLLYVVLGFLTANFYANQLGGEYTSLRVYFLILIFWPIGWPFLLYAKQKNK